MTSTTKIAVALVVFVCACCISHGAPAQTQGAPAATSAVGKTASLIRILQTLEYVERGARRAGAPSSSGDGFTLIAESSVAQAPVPIPFPASGEPTTAATIETQLDLLVKMLPKGTRWVKVMLPPVPPGKTLKGDALADFVLAQAQLFGTVGEAVLPEGSVEVLSQIVPSDKAKMVVPALNLRPVYLIINPRAHAAWARGVRDFTDLTSEQQKAWAKDAAEAFRNMDAAGRKETLQNMFQQATSLMEAVMQGMTPEEIKNFAAEMGGTSGEHKAEIPIVTVKPKN